MSGKGGARVRQTWSLYVRLACPVKAEPARPAEAELACASGGGGARASGGGRACASNAGEAEDLLATEATVTRLLQ